MHIMVGPFTYIAVIPDSGLTKTWIAGMSFGRRIFRQGNFVEPGPHNKWKWGVPVFVAKYTVTHKGLE